MKKLLALGLIASFTPFIGGCLPATAHSGGERFRKITYNWSIDGAQAQDDIDHLLLLRDGVTMSIWNIQYQ